MNKTIVLAMVCVIAGCAAGPQRPAVPITPTAAYLEDAMRQVDGQMAIMDLSGALGARRSDLRSDGDSRHLDHMRAEYQRALADASGNPVAAAALKEHWIKLAQCLAEGNNYAALNQCKYDLAERRARVEVELETKTASVPAS